MYDKMTVNIIKKGSWIGEDDCLLFIFFFGTMIKVILRFDPINSIKKRETTQCLLYASKSVHVATI